MIDSHCHFDFSPFKDDPSFYLKSANKFGVEQLIVPSIGKDNWSKVIKLSNQFPKQIHLALGIHPWWINEHKQNDLDDLQNLLQTNIKKCIAIGECGLDFAIDNFNKNKQIDMLSRQFELAVNFNLPVILHCRKAHNELLSLLNQFPQLKGVLHAFSGSEQQGKEYIKRGFYLGIGGTITYQRANKTRKAVSKLPLDYMLLETDAPDMPLANFPDQANLPERLPIIAKELALLKDLDISEIQRTTVKNTRKLFNI